MSRSAPICGRSDHPRVCGECVSFLPIERSGEGSSPRVRGMPRSSGRPVTASGIIPACAGNAFGFTRGKLGTTDHPRVCGECADVNERIKLGPGSSPRVRGMHGPVQCRGGRAGIIPACAGNACPPSLTATGSPDHPRVCGECVGVSARIARGYGSSPRVRGMRVPRPGEVVRPGIIPACAGNALAATLRGVDGGDHPRVCGECSIQRARSSPGRGSSPRVRGMRLAGEHRPHGLRIIPACAGNARRPGRDVRHHQDHPRVCGECTPVFSRTASGEGSSPRVRGMPGEEALPLVSTRDHPRVCGECGVLKPGGDRDLGSSPRVRGMLAAAALGVAWAGIIPACAGNAPWGFAPSS